MAPKPTHPELLDWLATQFVEHKWSIKAMHRLMLTFGDLPAIYVASGLETIRGCGPGNELLWRMNWGRLRLRCCAILS